MSRTTNRFTRCSLLSGVFFPPQRWEYWSSTAREGTSFTVTKAAAPWIANVARRCCLIPGLHRHLVWCLQGLRVPSLPATHINLDNLPNFRGSATSVGAGVNPWKKKVSEYDSFPLWDGRMMFMVLFFLLLLKIKMTFCWIKGNFQFKRTHHCVTEWCLLLLS